MKRILSVLIIAAIVISCLSMITFASGESAVSEAPQENAFRVTAKVAYSGKYALMEGKPNFTVEMATGGYIERSFTIINTGETSVNLYVSYTYKRWTAVAGTDKSYLLRPGETVVYSAKIPVNANGYIDAENTKALSDVGFRFDVRSSNDIGDQVVVMANDGNLDWIKQISKIEYGNGTGESLLEYIYFDAEDMPEPLYGGASIIATNRIHRCSTPSQEMKDAVAANGLGTYFIGAYVRLLETPDEPISVQMGLQVTTGESTSFPLSSKTVISDTEWHFVGGTIDVNKSGITSAITFGQILYNGKSGDAGAYLGDMEWDAFAFCKVDANGNLGENLFVNPDANIDARGNISGWGKNQSLTMTSSIMPKQEGSALKATDRSSKTSGPSQNVTEALLKAGKGTYAYSAYMRVLTKPATTQNLNIGVELTKNGSGVGWPAATAVSVSDTEWHLITGTLTISNDFDRAVTFVNTYEGSGAGCDIELDGVFLAKQGADGLYSENLIKNPTMEPDAFGNTTNWGLYRSATLENTGFDITQTPEHGVENADGSVTYARGLVPADDKNILYAGRWTDKDETGKQVAFEGYVEIKFTGTSLRMLAPASGNVYAEVDGVLSHKLITLTTGAVIASGLSEGEHTVKLFAYAQRSWFTVGGFAIDKGGKTLPIEEPKKIEFIGDSISEGYVDPDDKLSDLENNSYLNSFALKTGRKLNAEYGWSFNTVAFGGIGISRTGSPDPLTMPQRYFAHREYTSADGTDAAAALSVAGTLDKTQYVPDYIVINLGTNDGSINNTTFINDYKAFITALKNAYPNVTIFCMTPFNSAKQMQVIKAAKSFDSGVYVIDSSQWGISGGSDGLHPAPASLDTAAEKLFNVIKAYEDKGILPEANYKTYVGIKYTATTAYNNAYPIIRGNACLTADMAQDGYITKRYTVYNTGNTELPISIMFQNDWDPIPGATVKVEGTIGAGKSEVYELRIPVNANGYAGNASSTCELSALTFRAEIATKVISAGSEFIIIPEEYGDYIDSLSLMKMGSGTGGGALVLVDKAPSEEIIGATLQLGESLTLNYHVRLWDNTDAMLDVIRNGKAVTLTGAYDSETGYYVYSYGGINPQCMTDIIDARLYLGAETIAVKDGYSVKEYADNLAKKSAAELDLTPEKHEALITLLSDMLVYGKSSQDYMNYRTDAYATDGITWLDSSSFSVPDDVVKNVILNGTDNKVVSAGLRLDNTVRIFFSVSIKDSDVEIYLDGEKITEADGNKVYTESIMATEFDNTHTIVLKQNGDVIANVEYNVNAYIASKYNSTNVGEVVKAISAYGASAQNYLGE